MASPSPSHPRKLFYRVQEAAEIVGVQPYVLRYWETRFPMLRPERFANDERRYRQSDLQLLLRIRELLYEEKFTIAGAVEKLEQEDAAERLTAPAPIVRPAVVVEDETPARLPSIQADPLAPPPPPAAAPAALPNREELLQTLRAVRAELEDLRRQFLR